MPDVFAFLKKLPPSRVGLDIGSRSLKAAEITFLDKGEMKISACGIKDIRNVSDIPAAIKQLFGEAGIKTKDVNISLSGDNVISRHIPLPKMDEEELKKAIVFELGEHIPFRPEEIYYDFFTLGDDPAAKNKMRVFLVATKKEFLEERLDILRRAGLTAKVITTDALALKNAFYYNYPEKEQTNVTLLNIGEKITNLIIVRDKIPYFVRDTRFGGETITSLLETKLGLNKEDAEKLKYALGTAPQETTAMVKASMASLLNEIFICLDFFENLTEQKIDEIYMCGGFSQLAGLTEFLQGYLNISIIALDPFRKFSLAPRIKESTAKILPFLPVAIGLALEDPAE